MSQELRVEFKMAASNRRPVPKPKLDPATRTDRHRVDRAARKARNLALAHYIDGLVRSGEVADLAAVARMCGVSRARVSMVVGLLGVSGADKNLLQARSNSLIGDYCSETLVDQGAQFPGSPTSTSIS